MLPLGDSITYGTTFSGDINGGYRLPLEKTLSICYQFMGSQTTNGTGMRFPNHEGWPGYTISQISTKVSLLSTDPAPSVVLLDAGTNDLGSANIITDYDSLLSTIHTKWPNTKILCATIGPFTGSYAYLSGQETALNNHILALSNGYCVPVTMAVNLSASLQTDGIHPNQAGYNTMANVWNGTIVNL